MKFFFNNQTKEGIVLSSYDGIFEASGLSTIKSGDLVSIDNRLNLENEVKDNLPLGIIFTLLKSKVVGAFFSEIQSVLAGNKVYPLNEPATISCDFSILGKLVDSFGMSFFF